ncbi:MAG: 50S ribosomal protein L11 methyltransferase [Candidatus Nealsonbacteria bacterium]|nr:50S ribosomal protein L11 methyltransferase [Candidatus Nealsonbacteria bacterium]
MLRFFEAILPFMFWGAIYVPTSRSKVEKIIEVAAIKPGDKAVDLGSGDGRLVIALAKSGAEAHGYEINPLLVALSRKNIRKEKIIDKAFINLGSFWGQDLSSFNVVAVYGMNHVMRRLEKKLKKELKPGSKIVSNGFEFPSWPPVKAEEGIYLYIK